MCSKGYSKPKHYLNGFSELGICIKKNLSSLNKNKIQKFNTNIEIESLIEKLMKYNNQKVMYRYLLPKPVLYGSYIRVMDL